MKGSTTRQIIISEKSASEWFSISTRKVRETFKAARVAPGEYDLREFIRIHVEEKDEIDAQKRLKEKDLEIKDAKLKILTGEYHHADDVRMIVSDMLIRFSSKLKAIPQKLAPGLVNRENSREIENILKEGINECLSELSEYTFTPDKTAKTEDE